MSHPVTPDSVAKRKAMYKVGSPASGGAWKETYKRRCAERFHKSRSKLLDKYRNIVIDETTEEDSLETVMNQELQKMQEECLTPFTGPITFEDVVKTMEEIKQELLEWEAELIFQSENQQMKIEVENHEAIIENGENQVICPICCVNHLEVQINHLKCRCGVNINLRQDAITLSHVKQSLEEGVTSHFNNCHCKPSFKVKTKFLQTNLILTCLACDFMYIVV
nr:RPA-interacting protein A-like [Ciona intestinalis]|eukprot:XP_018670338.1 RPA-interacting protein A-like [Ciona intestinalis]